MHTRILRKHRHYSPLLLGGTISEEEKREKKIEDPLISALFHGSYVKELTYDFTVDEKVFGELVDVHTFQLLCATKNWVDLLAILSKAECTVNLDDLDSADDLYDPANSPADGFATTEDPI